MTEEERRKNAPWGTWGKPANRDHNIITSLELDSAKQEIFNHKLQAKYREMTRELKLQFAEFNSKEDALKAQQMLL